MKKFLLFLLMITSAGLAETPSAEQLQQAVIQHMNPESAKGIMKQTINTTSGDKRTLTYETFSGEKGKNSLMRYLSPSRVKGNALLLKNFSDDIWMYNSRTRRVRKLASHAKKQKFEGSDFTYEDMGSGKSWEDDYTPQYLGISKCEDQDCHKLSLGANSEDLSYSKILCYLRNSDYYPLKMEYYNGEGNLEKILHLKNIKLIQNIPTAIKMVMENVQDHSSTVMEYEKIEYNIDFEKNFFSERNLKR